MSAAARDILARLAAVGARVEEQGGRLLLRAGPRPVPPLLIEEARSVKPELLSLLTRFADRHRRSSGAIDAQLPQNEHLWAKGSDSAVETEDIRHRCSSPGNVSIYGADEHLWGEEEDERAAIVEHDGGVLRAWAEGFARLDTDRPPRALSPRHWRAICEIIGAFLDQSGAEAVRLGWTAQDLFGADADRPEVTWLNSGPLWSGQGARVVELHRDRIVFETATGARQTAPKRPPLRPRVLPWELAS